MCTYEMRHEFSGHADFIFFQDALPRDRPHPPDVVGHRGGQAVLRRPHQLPGQLDDMYYYVVLFYVAASPHWLITLIKLKPFVETLVMFQLRCEMRQSLTRSLLLSSKSDFIRAPSQRERGCLQG